LQTLKSFSSDARKLCSVDQWHMLGLRSDSAGAIPATEDKLAVDIVSLLFAPSSSFHGEIDRPHFTSAPRLSMLPAQCLISNLSCLFGALYSTSFE
jgi:hypothetical protein